MFSEKELKTILQHPLLLGINREQIVPILSGCSCVLRSFSDGETVHSPDSDQKLLGLILDGSATVCTKDPDKNTLLRFLERGDSFGVANLFTDEPFVSVIKAHKKCSVLLMTEDAVRALLECDKEFLYRYLAFLSGRVCFLNRKIGYLTAGSAERRLALYLSSFRKDEILLSVSFSVLSELLDVGRASLYRAFDRLSEDGYIQKDGRTIRILKSDLLGAAYQ